MSLDLTSLHDDVCLFQQRARENVIRCAEMAQRAITRSENAGTGEEGELVDLHLMLLGRAFLRWAVWFDGNYSEALAPEREVNI